MKTTTLALKTRSDGTGWQLESRRRKDPQSEDDPVYLRLEITGSFLCSQLAKNSIIGFLDEYPCKDLTLSFFYSDEIDIFVKEIIVKAIGSPSFECLELIGNPFSDSAFQFIHHECVRANVGIKKLSLSYMELSDQSWDNFLSTNLGTGEPDSEITFQLMDTEIDYDEIDYDEGGFIAHRHLCISDERLAQIFNNLSGFRSIVLPQISFLCRPATFATLGTILSSTNCEISSLTFYGAEVDEADDTGETIFDGEEIFDCLKIMFDNVTTNKSLKRLELASWRSDYSYLTETDLIGLAKSLHKFPNLEVMKIMVSSDTTLEFLSRLLDPSFVSNNSLTILDIQHFGPRVTSYNEVELLLTVAQHFRNLTSFGTQLMLEPAVEHVLRMNFWRKKFLAHDPSLPLSLWPVVLSARVVIRHGLKNVTEWALDNPAKTSKGKKSDDKFMFEDFDGTVELELEAKVKAAIASVRYEMIRGYLLPAHFVLAKGKRSHADIL